MLLRIIKGIPAIFKRAGYYWVIDDVPAMASAVAYHAILSLAPLLIVLLGTVSLVTGSDAVEREIVIQIKEAVGEKAALAIQSVISSTQYSRSGILAIGGSSLALLIIFSTGVFKQLIGSLNSIWGLDEGARRGFRGGVIRMIRRHFIAFLMLIGLGLWLYLSLISKTMTAVPETILFESFPWLAGFMPHLPFLLAPVIFTLVIAVFFRILPDATIKWHDVWFGAAVTAILLIIGEKAIAFYLQKTIVSSLYGAAGSLIIILLWVYWSANVFLFGVETARAYSEMFGSRSSD